MKVIHERKKFKIHYCNKCEKSFSSTTDMKVHYDRHNLKDLGLKFMCNICDKSCTSRDGFKNHMKTIHNGESLEPEMVLNSFHKGKSFACDKCEKAYTKKCHLQRHLRQSHILENVNSGV